MKLHWGPNSPFVRKVMVAAHETGLAGQITLVRSLVSMDKPNPAVLRDNPLGKIPTLTTDDGEVIFESDLICAFLDELHHGSKLVPLQGSLGRETRRWNAVGSGGLEALVLWRNELMRPEAHRSVPTLQAYALKTATTLDWIEREVPALSAATLGVGHITIGCLFGYLDLRFAGVLDWRRGRPACARWFAAFSARPSMRATDSAAPA